MKIFAESSLVDGQEVLLRIASEEEKCEEAMGIVKDGRLEYAWMVRNVGFVAGEDGQDLPEVEIFLDVEHGGKHYSPNKNLRVKKVVSVGPANFDKHYTWGKYGVHAHFQQSITGRLQTVIVKKKVMKTWGGTYVDLTKAGVKGKLSGLPWDSYRWARCKGKEMAPHEYWNGSAWKPIPQNVGLDGGEFGTFPLVKTGDTVHWIENTAAVWPDPVVDYKFEDYASKREAWIKDSNERWSGVWKIRRKGCKANPDKTCCTYGIKLLFSMEKVESYSEDVICLSPGYLRSNAGLMFYGDSRIAMAAHEVGHLVGLPDEYEKGAVDTTVHGDGAVNGLDDTTLMGSFLQDETKNKIKRRHYANFAVMARSLYASATKNNEEWVVV